MWPPKKPTPESPLRGRGQSSVCRQHLCRTVLGENTGEGAPFPRKGKWKQTLAAIGVTTFLGKAKTLEWDEHT
jgi:hypothetical protein